MKKRIQLYVNTTKNDALKLSEKIKKELVHQGYEIVADSPDIIIGFGGDGTLIHLLAKHNYNISADYIGVNCGTLGFLQEFNVTDVVEFVNNIPSYIKTQLKFVAMEIEVKGKTYTFKALNEITIHDSDDKSFRTKLYIGKEVLENYVGTGLIFSTPTGSTALNLSAGGCILHPSIEAIQITPREAIANSKMHCLSKSICLPRGFDVMLKPNNLGDIKVCCDGKKAYVGLYDTIRVYYSNEGLIKLKDKNDTFIKTIREKLI